jgi:aminocarboxymuconate-semialdehyde decarboxylase
MDRVLFGSDYPYLRRDLAIRCADELRSTPALEEQERAAILSGTATRLFPRLAKLQ